MRVIEKIHSIITGLQKKEVKGFEAWTVSKIAWRWQKKESSGRMSPFAPGSKEQDLYNSIFGNPLGL